MTINFTLTLALLAIGALAGWCLALHLMFPDPRKVAVIVDDTLGDFERVYGNDLTPEQHEKRTLAVVKALTGIRVPRVPTEDIEKLEVTKQVKAQRKAVRNG